MLKLCYVDFKAKAHVTVSVRVCYCAIVMFYLLGLGPGVLKSSE